MESPNAKSADPQVRESFGHAIAHQNGGSSPGQLSFVGAKKVHHAADETAGRASGAPAVDENSKVPGLGRRVQDVEHRVFKFGERVRIDRAAILPWVVPGTRTTSPPCESPLDDRAWQSSVIRCSLATQIQCRTARSGISCTGSGENSSTFFVEAARPMDERPLRCRLRVRGSGDTLQGCRCNHESFGMLRRIAPCAPALAPKTFSASP